MQDVADAAGVSTMTVSRALRQDGRIATDTRRRVLEAVAKLGYVPDRIAGSFSSQRSGFVGVLVPSLNNPHFAETAAGLQERLAPAGLQLLIGNTNYRSLQAEQLIATMLERRPEAMIVTYDDYTARARDLLRNARIPIIEIWERPARPIGHIVGFSNRKAAAAMTRHLVDIGRRRIAYIGERDDAGTRGAERRKGFLDAMRRAGLDPKRRIDWSAPPINMTGGRDAMSSLLGRWPDSDAVMCVSDPAAFGALTACRLLGRTVPDDMAIAGFGDFEISRCSLPAISTVEVHGSEVGDRTGALVLDLLARPESRRIADRRNRCVVDIRVRPALRGSSLP
jgi:LacI family gluconate utilization system Gnt-I transcriptional repressor